MFRFLVALTILSIVTASIFEKDSEIETKHEVALVGENQETGLAVGDFDLEGQSDASGDVVIRAKRYYGCGCGCCGCGVTAMAVTGAGCGCGCCGCG
ncbi:unnamed protein product [Caenorhabditis angaria]|uniref:Uncharacterized protein n=1 Tax=Caenorhabditis angaria TaxID=860376 RepID=A0A9P1J3X4_9PELO|nr:unnamed protein product [Caenorhabditis angaria]